MQTRPTILAALAIPLAVSLVAASPAGAQTSRQQQEAACQADAQRFCSAEIPDEGLVGRCLMRNAKAISRACRDVMAAERKARQRR